MTEALNSFYWEIIGSIMAISSIMLIIVLAYLFFKIDEVLRRMKNGKSNRKFN